MNSQATPLPATPLVLFADDDADIRHLVSFGLKRFGYRVLLAGDGAEALRLAHEERPDLLILDVTMPLIDGHELTRRFRADSTMKGTPIILLTARAQKADVTQGFDVGADDYVTKPFSVQDLGQRVQAILGPAEDAKS